MAEERQEKGKEAGFVNMQEASRIIPGLRAAGWEEKAIGNFTLWIGTGDDRYKPDGRETEKGRE